VASCCGGGSDCDSFVSEIVPEVTPAYAPTHDTLFKRRRIMESLAVIYVGGGVVTIVIILIILFLLFGRG
jgi:hypothetical protein